MPGDLPWPSPIRVLAMHAHPDDVEFQCAGTLALLREAGCHRDDGDDDARRLRQRRARRRGDRRDPPRRGAGGGRPDRGRLPLPGVPRPGDLQRRRVAAAGHRDPPPGPARPHPDRAAGRLPLRPRDDQPARPRRLLRRPVPNYATRQWEPAPPLERIPHLYFVDAIEGTDRDGRPSRAGSTSTSRASSRLKRQMLACHASQRNWLLRQHGIDEYLDSQADGAPTAAPRSAWPRPRGSASTSAIPIRTTTCSSPWSVKTAAAARRRMLDEVLPA